VAGQVSSVTVPKFAISQSEAVTTVLISPDIKSLTRYGYDVMVTRPNLGRLVWSSHGYFVSTTARPNWPDMPPKRIKRYD